MLWEQMIPLMREGYHKEIIDRVYSSDKATILPVKEDVLRAMQVTGFLETKVVVIGQDPYFNEHSQGPEAHGLAFSVRSGIPTPPSLRNILKEVNRSIYGGEQVSLETDLSRWAQQGVLLINASLTVIAKIPNSHAKVGWQLLTDNIIETLSKEREHLVFMLWGAFAQKKIPLIDTSKHCVLATSHPSPLSAYRGFSGSDVFLHCNEYLQQHGITPIKW